MSLSFPILLSAVPLYTICASALGKDGELTSDASKKIEKERETWADIKDSHEVPEILQKNWFSDGGICSNFPIHFFDDWLPNRPTFGITLTTLPNEEALQDQGTQRTVNKDYQSASFKSVNYEGQLVTGQIRENVSGVYLPKADENVPPDWIKLDGDLINFLRQSFKHLRATGDYAVKATGLSRTHCTNPIEERRRWAELRYVAEVNLQHDEEGHRCWQQAEERICF
jgi:hypothetical protein